MKHRLLAFLMAIVLSFPARGEEPREGNDRRVPAAVIDWNRDGLVDLLGIQPSADAATAWDAMVMQTNLGTAARPRFSAAKPMADSAAHPLRLERGAGLLVADPDRDGDLDLCSVSPSSWSIWESSGHRTGDGPVVKPARVHGELHVSEWRRSLVAESVQRSFAVGNARLVDWEGDGDLDLLVAFHSRRTFQGTFTGIDLMFFELFENPDSEGWRFREPSVVRESRGLPIHAVAGPEGGVECGDWDGDGDLDLLYFHRQPEGEGRLMFAENDGTRAAPLFLKGIPILTITGRPTRVDWNCDGRFDLVAGSDFFENTNPLSGGRNATVAPRRPSGTRIPRPETFPFLVPRALAKRGDSPPR